MKPNIDYGAELLGELTAKGITQDKGDIGGVRLQTESINLRISVPLY